MSLARNPSLTFVFLLALTASCGGPPSPDGAVVREGTFEIHADGSVHYDGRELREPGESWGQSDVRSELTAIAADMEEEHLDRDHGTGPTLPCEWIVLRVEDDVRFADLWPFLRTCLAHGVWIRNFVFDLRECDSAAGPWKFQRWPWEILEGFVHVDWAAGPYPCWTVTANDAEPTGFRHVFEMVGGVVRHEAAQIDQLRNEPALLAAESCALRCGPDVPWRELVPVLELLEEAPFPLEVEVPPTPALWDQLGGDDER